MKLDVIQEKLRNIDHLNCGGCGLSALAMLRALKKKDKRTIIKIAYLFPSYEKDLFDTNVKVMNNKIQIPKAARHICILYDGKFVDGEGEVDISHYDLIQMVDEDFLLTTINRAKNWNSMFNRNNIKEIEKDLKIELKDITKRN